MLIAEKIRNTTEAICAYLKQNGYPNESISVEWGTRRLAVDLAVLARDLVTPLALYEVKTTTNRDSVLFGINNLRNLALSLELHVKCYLAIGKDTEPFFELYDVTNIIYNNEPINYPAILQENQITKPLSYKTLQDGIEGKIRRQRREKKQKRIDRIKPVCWILLPVLIIGIVLLDAFKIYELTLQRLITYGGFIVVILIPFYNEISLKEFTLKRKDNTND